jgi:arylsulfatase A-like enzyme
LDIAENAYDDTLSAEYAVGFLKQRHDRPFFLACGLFRPHLPWYVPERFFDLYPLDEIRLPAVRDDDLDDVPAAGRRLAADRRSDWETIRDAGRWKHAIRAYLASISYADGELGRVLSALEASPYGGNTIVVLWSDHGWHLGEKQHWHKSTLWEEATRVPLVIAAPGYQPGICNRPVSLLSLFPTLNELCGLEAIPAHDDVSLAPLLKDPQAPWKRLAIVEFRFGNAAVRSDRYRYIRYYDGGEELYDHETDPQEWHNLAANSEYADVKAELAVSITREWAEPAPTKKAFRFDPQTFTWTHKKTGKMTSGQRQVRGIE